MHACHLGHCEQSFSAEFELLGGNHAAGAIDDAFVAAIAAQQIVLARSQDRWLSSFAVGGACIGMHENRTGLGIGLQRRKGPQREDQIGVTGLDVAKAVPAGNAVTIG
ncbi:hypothetical protein D3C72_1955520 [compost metagenome]